MPKPGTERAVVDCATNLEQQIGAISRPSHLLGLVHAPVDQEVRCALGDRRSDAQTGPEAFCIVHQPCGLALEIFIDRMQRVPQLARRHPLRALAVLAFEDMHDLADPAGSPSGRRLPPRPILSSSFWRRDRAPLARRDSVLARPSYWCWM